MALIECPDCAKQVSEAAPACPHCGRPIAGQPANYPPVQPTKDQGCFLTTMNVGCGCFWIVVAIFGLLIMFAIGSS